jgi:hypothetical protein
MQENEWDQQKLGESAKVVHCAGTLQLLCSGPTQSGRSPTYPIGHCPSVRLLEHFAVLVSRLIVVDFGNRSLFIQLIAGLEYLHSRHIAREPFSFAQPYSFSSTDSTLFRS